MAFLDDARKAGGPFFLTMATVALHSGYGPRPNGSLPYGPVPKAEYQDLFSDVDVPRTANFNPDTPSGTSWLLKIPQLNHSEITRNDNVYRQRLRALQSVDDLVNGTIAYLEKYNLMDNTYIIYSSDKFVCHVQIHATLLANISQRLSYKPTSPTTRKELPLRRRHKRSSHHPRSRRRSRHYRQRGDNPHRSRTNNPQDGRC